MLWGLSMLKEIVQIDFKNVKKYCLKQELLNGCEIIIIKIDLSLDKSLKSYLLLSKIAKQKEILPLFVILNSSKDSQEKLKLLKNESYFIVEGEYVFQEFYKEIVEVLSPKGEGDICLDIADFKTVLDYKGITFFGSAQDSTKDAALVAIEDAVKNANIKDHSLHDMQAVLVHFTIHPDYKLTKIAHAMEIFYENTHYDADIILGTTTDKNLSKEYVKAVVLLTGCDSWEFKQMAVNNLPYKS